MGPASRHARNLANGLVLWTIIAALVLPLGPATAALGTPGPFAGALADGDSRSHTYMTVPPGVNCIIPVTYTVTLEYAPTGDTLRLWANGHSATGAGGFASVSFEGDCSEQFPVTVTGVDIALVAGYTVEVSQGPATA